MKLLQSLFAAGLLVLLPGCAGYSLGPTNAAVAGARSIQVNPVPNYTIEPRLGTALNHALRKQLQRDGTLALDSRGEGDIILNVSINNFRRAELAYQPNDTLTPQDYMLWMSAHVVATERAGGKVLLDRDITGRTTIRLGGDMVSAERQGLPLLAEDLARNITSALVEGEW